MGDMCTDGRFEIINRAKKNLLEATNIESHEDEMKVLDGFLFRCWQMGWLKDYEILPDRFIELRVHLRSNDSLERIRRDIEAELDCCCYTIDTIAVREITNDSNTYR